MGERVPLLALLTLGAAGCGLVIDLDPLPDVIRDSGGVFDAGPSPSDGGTTSDGAADGAAVPRDAAVADAGSPEAGAHDAGSADAGLLDAGPTDGSRLDAAGTDAGGSTTFCTPRDCDGDGLLEDLVTDPANCGTCGHTCDFLQICCNGECVSATTCSVVC